MLDFDLLDFDPTNATQLRQVLTDINSSQNKDRKKREWRGHEIDAGKTRKHVKTWLQEKHPDTWESFTISSVNVLRKVTKRVSKSYKEAPIRQLDDETSSENLAMIYKKGDFNEAYQRLEYKFNLHFHALAWVVNNPLIPTEFELRSLAPYVFDVIIDNDSNKLVAVILSYPDREITHSWPNEQNRSDGINQIQAESGNDSAPKSKKYAIWTDTKHVNVNARFNQVGLVTEIDYMILEGNPNNINPLGRLPFIWLTTEPENPERPFENPLFEETLNINVMESNLLTGANMAMTGILKYKYPEGSKQENLLVGHTLALELPQKNNPDAPETDADFINPSPDLAQGRETINSYTEAIINDTGLTGFNLSGNGDKQFSSGLDRALSMSDISEIRSEKISMMAKVEKEVFDIIKAYDSVNGTRMFSEDDELVVKYPKPQILLSESDVLKNIREKKDLGLIEEWEKFILLDPNMDEIGAREKLERIMEEKQERASMFNLGGRVANQQEASDQESQDS